MSAVADHSRGEWLDIWRSLSDDDLVEQRFKLDDLAAIADRGSELSEFVRWALKAIGALECQRRAQALLREAAEQAFPDVDADVFADAALAIVRGRRQLDLDLDFEIFNGALEVAQRRGETGDSHA